MTVESSDIDIPEVLAELEAAFAAYEDALMADRPADLVAAFWEDARAIRYGVAENLHGHAEIAAFRASRSASGGAPKRTTTRTSITTFGRDFGTTNIEYVRDSTGLHGRQSQTWVRTPEGWRIVAAHVSLIRDRD
ncbi:MAG: oxalurate catabolism protein HpxZ [Azospirillaceae bacterium]